MALPVDFVTLTAFVGAVLLLLLSPGPNMAFVVAHGMTLGWRGGLAAAAGIAAADAVLTVIVALGVAVAYALSPLIEWTLRIAGAAYLAALAVQAWRKPVQFLSVRASATQLLPIARRALLNSLLNPKPLLFFLVFLPAFTSHHTGSTSSQILFLGLVLTVVAALFHGALGACGGLATGWMRTRPKAIAWASRAMAVLFVALAARLVCAS